VPEIFVIGRVCQDYSKSNVRLFWDSICTLHIHRVSKVTNFTIFTLLQLKVYCIIAVELGAQYPDNPGY